MAITLSTTMDALGAAMLNVTGLTKAYTTPTEAIRPPCVIVGYPEGDMQLAATFGRGSDRMTFPVIVVCGLQFDAGTRTLVSSVITSASDGWDALNSDATLAAMGSIRVDSVTIEGWQMSPENPGLVYTAVRFAVEITA